MCVSLYECVFVRAKQVDRSKGVFVSKPNQEQQTNQISVLADLLPRKEGQANVSISLPGKK